ncbi:MAG TPA: TetR/AcrR family transcriptional regulator [Ilumatobacter sp.]|nr:TetR/AcrR family transcriptional regulator [Ilumatobacter sp.]
MAIADAEGLHSLTIRRLANETKVGAMTLYSYFSNKDDLLQNMADHVLSRFVAPTGRTDDVKEYIRLLANGWHDMMIRHPTIVQLILHQVTSRPAARSASFERPIADLIALGLPGEQAVRIYGFTVTYALGFSAYQLPRPWGYDLSEGSDVDEQRRQQSLLVQSLPIREYPAMVGNAGAIVSLPTREQFEWGLDVFIAGIDALLASDHAG